MTIYRGMDHTIYDHTPDTGIVVTYSNSNIEIERFLENQDLLSDTYTKPCCCHRIIGLCIIEMQGDHGKFKPYSSI